MLRAMGNSKASMITSLMMNLMNVAGNALLIYGLKMEVAGAAAASLAARVFARRFMVRLLLNEDSPIHLIRPRHPEPDLPMIKRIFSQGIPNGLENSMFQVGKLMVTGIVAMFSESVIAANAISNNIATMANLPGIAIGLAMVTVVGQCVGAGSVEQAKHYSMKLLGIAYLLMAVTNATLFFFAAQIAGIFNLSPEGIAAAVEVLRWYAFAAAIFWPASFTVPNVLRAAGDAVSPWAFLSFACGRSALAPAICLYMSFIWACLAFGLPCSSTGSFARRFLPCGIKAESGSQRKWFEGRVSSEVEPFMPQCRQAFTATNKKAIGRACPAVPAGQARPLRITVLYSIRSTV